MLGKTKKINIAATFLMAVGIFAVPNLAMAWDGHHGHKGHGYRDHGRSHWHHRGYDRIPNSAFAFGFSNGNFTVALGSPRYVERPRVVLVSPPRTVIVAPVVVNRLDAITVNVPNSFGGYTPILIQRAGNGYIGPQGEFYPEFPMINQLTLMYGK